MVTYTPRHEEKVGSDLSGTTGSKNRTYALANSNAILASMQILIQQAILQPTVDFTLASNTVTFLNTVWDDQVISISYWTEDVSVSEPSVSIGTLPAGFSSIISTMGKPIRVRYFSAEIGSVWDDDTTLTEVTGSELWTSGIVLPLSDKYGSEDVVLVEQGKLRNQDQKLYVNGSLDFTGVGSNFSVKIGMNGSPTQTDNYTMVPFGGVPYEAGGVQIYKKVFIRRLTNGSLIGE